MQIAIIDDAQDVRSLYTDVCKSLGHKVKAFADLVTGISFVQANPVDVVFLDNHFHRKGRDAIYGVDHLPQIRAARPHCFVVLMSSKDFAADMVRMAVQHKIEFFLVNPPAADNIRGVLRQIELIRQSEVELVEQVLTKIRRSAESSESMFSKLLGLLSGEQGREIEITVDYLGPTGDSFLLEGMRPVAHVARGDTLTFESSASSTVKESFRAGSKLGLGLTLGDSKSLLNSVLGAKIQSSIEAAAHSGESGHRFRDLTGHRFRDDSGRFVGAKRRCC